MDHQQYHVSRQFAAEILNVSVRTLDRYSKSDKISSVRRGRQLFFSEQELLDFKAKQMAQQELEEVQKARLQRHRERPSTSRRRSSVSSRKREFADVEKAQVLEQEGDFDDVDAAFADIRDSMLRRSPDESIFRSLYKKAEHELKELRGKLEMANYRVGNLEAQISSMVPQIEFKKQRQELLELAQENRSKSHEMAELESQLQLERWVKRIYGGFLFFMMGLFPLLVILRLFA